MRASGAKGERLAEQVLRAKGYRILARNYRVHGVGEVDLVARDRRGLVLVEVKVRRPGMELREAIPPQKVARMRRVGEIFLQRERLQLPVRLEFVLIALNEEGQVESIEHGSL